MDGQTRRQLPLNTIPFVLAASGHCDLVPEHLPRLREEVRKVIRRIAARLSSTPLLLLTGLAKGADQLIADVAIEEGAYLAAALPLSKDVYRASMDKASQEEFDRLLDKASIIIHPPLLAGDEEDTSEASPYSKLGTFLAQHCQALIALWDGSGSYGEGGTFDAVRSVLNGVEYKDCIEPFRGTVYHIVTPRKDSAERLSDPAFSFHVMRCQSEQEQIARAVPVKYISKLPKGTKEESDKDEPFLKPADQKQWRLVPRNPVWRWLARQPGSQEAAGWRGRCWERIVEPAPSERHLNQFNRGAQRVARKQSFSYQLKPAEWIKEPWRYLERIDACYGSADAISMKYQAQTKIYRAGILAFVALAALAAATHAELPEKLDWLWLVLPGCLFIAFVIHRFAQLFQVENWFLDSRVLAEALRVQYFWELGGVREPVWNYYVVHRPSELGWVFTALCGVSLLAHEHDEERPRQPAEEGIDVAARKWVQGQANWYRKKSKEQHAKLERAESISKFTLGLMIFVSLAYGGIALFESGAKPILGNVHLLAEIWAATKAWEPKIFLLTAIVSIAVGAFKIWLEQSGYDEQARNYSRMHHLFFHRYKRLNSLLSRKKDGRNTPVPVQDVTAILRDIGTKALEENSIWLIMHREHQLKVTSLG